MILQVKSALLSNAPIKIISLMLGYILWSFLGQLYTIEQKQNIPIYIYNLSDNYVATPNCDSISTTIAGKKDALSQCSDFTFYIDATTLKEGKNYIVLAHEHLLVPQSIILLNSKPCTIEITLSKKEITCT